MARLCDSHIHLSDGYYAPNLAGIISMMRRLGMRACCVSTGNRDSAETMRIAAMYRDVVLPFVGIHPEMASEGADTVADIMTRLHDDVSGIGEIGLDPSYVDSPEAGRVQERVFARMLGLAEKYDKPISVHSRKSLDRVLETLRSYNLRVLLHWFDGNKRQLASAMDDGHFVSYGPVLVYAHDKQRLLSRTRPERLLVETDGPVPFSRCFEGRHADISYIPSVILCASRALGMPYENLCDTLESNSASYLGEA